MNGKGDTFRPVDRKKYRDNYDDIFSGEGKRRGDKTPVVVTDEIGTRTLVHPSWAARRLAPMMITPVPAHPCTGCPKDDTCGMRCTALALHEYRPLGDFKNAWASALKTAKIEDFHFHDLRHQAATNLVNAGVPERIVSELANWKTDMLRTYYSFNSAEACKQLSEIWGEATALCYTLSHSVISCHAN